MAHRFIELRFMDLAALHQHVFTVEVSLHLDEPFCSVAVGCVPVT